MVINQHKKIFFAGFSRGLAVELALGFIKRILVRLFTYCALGSYSVSPTGTY
jgi:hypothetical protein